jgi:crossover junction endodeoxyribonuclease RusA
VIQFRAIGAPVPQGSMKVIHGRVLHSQGSALAVWRSSVAWAAKQAGATLSDQPIDMAMVFIMPRPKSVKRPFPTVAPDLDKLVRGVLDALTGIAYLDDAQVISISAHKIYGTTPGVEVRLAEKKMAEGIVKA